MSETGIVERLRSSSVSTVVQAAAEAISLIERQQKAINLLLRAIEPFAISDNGKWDDGVPLGGVTAPFTYGDIRAARSAKEQVVRILKGEEK